MNPNLDRVRILIRKLQLVGRIDFRIELDCLDRRSLEAQNLRAIAAALRTHSLNLKRASHGIGKVLQRDDAAHRCRVGVDKDNAAFQETWRIREGAHKGQNGRTGPGNSCPIWLLKAVFSAALQPLLVVTSVKVVLTCSS